LWTTFRKNSPTPYANQSTQHCLHFLVTTTVLKDSGSKVETTAAIGDELRQVTARLNKIMGGFRFNSSVLIVSARHEKRGAPRAQNSLRVMVTQDGEESECLSQDISLKGLRLKLPRPLSTQHELGLLLYLPSATLDKYQNQQRLALQARVSWQRQEGDWYLCGVEFLHLDHAQRSAIKKCFGFLNRNAEY